MLAGAASPAADGRAQLRFAAEPRPPGIFEVVVTRGVDDASVAPHGVPMLHWFGASVAPKGARPFDFVTGASSGS